MTTEWSHLPNAVHIDRVLDSLKSHPEEWAKRWGSENYGAAWAIAQGTIRENERYPAYLAAISKYGTASGAILTLIAYDDSAHLLESSAEEINLLNVLGHPYAILMLPAVMTYQRIAELTA